MHRHVNNVCNGAIRKTSQIRRYLDEATTLLHAFVTTRLDSPNSLLYGLPARLVSCLTFSPYNTCTNAIALAPSSVSKSLQNSSLTFKAQTCPSPAYLSKLVHHCSPTRTLRSSQHSLLSTTRASSIFHGHRSFSYAAPFLWNNLPVHYTRQANFLKSLLKTNLFKAAFLVICLFVSCIFLSVFILQTMRLEDFCIRHFTNVLLLLLLIIFG